MSVVIVTCLTSYTIIVLRESFPIRHMSGRTTTFESQQCIALRNNSLYQLDELVLLESQLQISLLNGSTFSHKPARVLVPSSVSQ